MEISKRQFNYLALFTLFGFSAIGFAVIYFFQNRNPLSVFEMKYEWYWQIIIGLVYGLGISLIAKQIIKTKWMSDISIFFAEVVKDLKLSTNDILFYSLCAGVGEEILFRGGIQFYLGIWITSVLFIALHGYINPMNWKMSIYGLFMILLSAGLGYLYDNFGMISAMTAHFIYDVVMFLFLKNKKSDLLFPHRPDKTIIPEV